MTDEYFDEICSQLESTNKDEVEEYVRQLYVYTNDDFNEENMSKREDEENISKQIEYYEDTLLDTCGECHKGNVELPIHFLSRTMI